MTTVPHLLRTLLTVAALALAAPVAAQTVHYDLASTSVLRINLPVSQAVTVTMSESVGKIVSADPAIAEAQPITDRSIYLVGRTFGTTTVNLFSAAGHPVGLLAVEVGADTADMARSIKAALPNSKVKVSAINGRVHVSGSVSDALSKQKVLDIVAQYGSPAIVDTITLEGGQQVNLEVRILEARRDAGRELGLAWGGNVGPVGVNVADTNTGTFSAFMTNVISAGLGIDLNVTIRALEGKGHVRTLA